MKRRRKGHAGDSVRLKELFRKCPGSPKDQYLLMGRGIAYPAIDDQSGGICGDAPFFQPVRRFQNYRSPTDPGAPKRRLLRLRTTPH